MRKPGAKAIVFYDNRICLVLRDNNPAISHPNKWNLPGGGIEDGEIPIEAVKRELKEEIDLNPTEVIQGSTTVYPDGSLVYRFFVPVTPAEKETVKLISESQRLDWFTLDECLRLAQDGQFSPYMAKYLEVNQDLIKAVLAGKRDLEWRDEKLDLLAIK